MEQPITELLRKYRAVDAIPPEELSALGLVREQLENGSLVIRPVGSPSYVDFAYCPKSNGELAKAYAQADKIYRKKTGFPLDTFCEHNAEKIKGHGTKILDACRSDLSLQTCNLKVRGPHTKRIIASLLRRGVEGTVDFFISERISKMPFKDTGSIKSGRC